MYAVIRNYTSNELSYIFPERFTTRAEALSFAASRTPRGGETHVRYSIAKIEAALELLTEGTAV